MTVGELIEMLEDYGAGRDVMIATQPSWPMAHGVDVVIDGAAMADGGLLDADDHNVELGAVWIGTGGQPYPDPYAPNVWDRAER